LLGPYERALDQIVWTLSGVISPRAACLTAQFMGTGPRFKTITAQLHLRKVSEPEFEKYISKINKIMTDTHAPQEIRNRVIHDAWFVDTNRDEPGQFRTWPYKDLVFGLRKIDIARIEKMIEQTKTLTTKTTALYEKINADVATSLQRRRRG